MTRLRPQVGLRSLICETAGAVSGRARWLAPCRPAWRAGVLCSASL